MCLPCIEFLIGRRKCLGESVAKIENFLFFGNLMKHFHFSAENPESKPSLNIQDGLTIGPKHFNARITER